MRFFASFSVRRAAPLRPAARWASARRQIMSAVKYWPPIGRVDNVYGDRNLFCSCVPVSEDA